MWRVDGWGGGLVAWVTMGDDQTGGMGTGELVDYPRGTRFGCPESGCGRDRCPVHDTMDKTWRHLDFFQHKAFLHARVPRVRCPAHGVRLVAVGWARPGSGFTMLFEALVLTFAKAMPMRRVQATVGEHDTRVWRIVEHHVATARAKEDFSGVRRGRGGDGRDLGPQGHDLARNPAETPHHPGDQS